MVKARTRTFAALPLQATPERPFRPQTATWQHTGMDVLIAFGLALAVFVTRFPVRSRRVFNWDAVNFVLAMAHYDVRFHRPHPPGYPVFVAMGRLLMFVIPDANGALVAVAMLLSAGAVAALFWLGKTLSDRSTGVIAALYLLFSVTFWTNGAVALAYASLALFGILVALYAFQLRAYSTPEHRTSGTSPLLPLPMQEAAMTARLATRYSLFLSIAFALGGGVRPDLLLFLAPLWIWGHWHAGWRRTITGALVAVAIVACWAIPMVALSGGFVEYLNVFRAYTTTDVLQRYSVAQNGLRALLVNLRDTATYTGYALYALALPIVCAFVHLLGQRFRLQLPERRMPPMASPLFFALWIAPMVLFYTWVHIGDPGYVFTFVPALLLIAARSTAAFIAGATSSASWRPRLRWLASAVLIGALLVGLPIAVNTGIFLTRPLALTAPGIRQQDRTIDEKLAYVRAHGDPATTLLVSYESYRHWVLYLPDYHTQFVDVTYGTEADRTLPIPPGITRVILMDDTLIRAAGPMVPLDTATVARDRVETIAAPAAPLHFAPVSSPIGTPRT